MCVWQFIDRFPLQMFDYYLKYLIHANDNVYWKVPKFRLKLNVDGLIVKMLCATKIISRLVNFTKESSTPNSVPKADKREVNA